MLSNGSEGRVIGKPCLLAGSLLLSPLLRDRERQPLEPGGDHTLSLL